MPAIDLSQLCKEPTLCLDLDKLQIVFPGGFNLQGQAGTDVPDCLDTARGLLSQLNAALGPLGPLLNMILTVIDLFKCVQAIPDSLGPPPDPTKLIAAIERVEADIDKLLGVVPEVSVPRLIKSVLGLIVQMLTGIRNRLASLADFQNAISVLKDRQTVLGNMPNGVGAFAAQQVSISIGCSTASLQTQVAGLNSGLAPLAALLEIIQELASLVGIELPALPASLSDGLEISADLPPLDNLITVLSEAASAIPV